MGRGPRVNLRESTGMLEGRIKAAMCEARVDEVSQVK